MSSRSYLSIGDVLTLLRQEFPDITISKIRFLESQGLVNPERTPSGYRKFYEPDVERLRWVLRQQREHFLPLKVIKDRLDDGTASTEGRSPVPAAPADHGAASADPEPVDVGTADQVPVLVGQRSASAGAMNGGLPVRAVPQMSGGPPPEVAAGGAPGVGHGVPTERPVSAQQTPLPVGGGADPTRPPAPRPQPAPQAPTQPAAQPAPTQPAPTQPVAQPVAQPAPTQPAAPQAQPHPQPAAPPAPTPAPAAPGPRSAPPAAVAPTPRDQGKSPAPAAPRAQPAPVSTAPQPAPAAAPSAPTPSAPTPAAPPAPKPAAAAPTPAAAPTAAPAPSAPVPPPTATHVATTGTSMTVAELSVASGLASEVLNQLQEFGLIRSTVVGGSEYFDEDALAVASLAAGFARYGIEPRHLRIYKNAADREAGFVEQIVLPLVRQRNPEARQRAVQTADELTRLGQGLRSVLLENALRDLLGG